jgi:peptidoglycan/LPS O-acetylase OafA/YrhL
MHEKPVETGWACRPTLRDGSGETVARLNRFKQTRVGVSVRPATLSIAPRRHNGRSPFDAPGAALSRELRRPINGSDQHESAMRLTNQPAPLAMSDGGTPPGIDMSGILPRSAALHREATEDAAPAEAAPASAATTRGASVHLRAPKYRPDIDGLRAVAVLAVLLFHAFPAQLPGGFVGVDVFFVISGFLISTIVFESIEDGRFSYAEFYVRRIRRIFPALLVVLGSCLVFGWFALMPSEYQQLGKHTFAGATFLSNIALWREAGYFDNTAPTKPLLHLWSLGVEEQFYIFWPLLASFAYRRRVGFPLLLVCMALASFAVSVVTSTSNPTAAFYSPLSRFWELMIGGSLAWLMLHKPGLVQHGPRASNAMSIVGLLLIAVAIACMSENDTFPGWRALLPTVGAFLVICAGPRAWLNQHALGSRAAVAIGLISYPLYLWHWPLLSFANILSGGLEVSVWTRLTLALASIALAALTYRFAELPIRATKPGLLQIGALCALLGLFGLYGAFLFSRDGLPSRPVAALPGYVQFAQNQKMRDSIPSESCRLEAPNAERFCTAYNAAATGPVMVVWGDSHSGAWLPVLQSIAAARNMRLFVFMHVGCPPLLDTRRSDGEGSGRDCSRLGLAESIVSSIQDLKPAIIFYIGRWSLYGNGWTRAGKLQKATHFITTSPDSAATLATSRAALTSQLPATVKALAAIAPRVVVFQNPPVLKGDLLPRFYAHPERIEPTTVDNLRTESFERKLVASAASVANVRIFDPVPHLCKGQTCEAVVGGVPVYEDDNHVSAQGSMLFRQAILDAM